MSYEYVVVRGAGFTLLGKEYNVGDVVSEPDAVAEFEKNEHLLKMCSRVPFGHPCGVNAPKPEPPAPAKSPQPAMADVTATAPALPANAAAPAK